MKKSSIVVMITLVFLFVLLPNSFVKAEETFEPDENGVYHITSVDDFSAFVQKTTLKNGGDYAGYSVSLDTDLTIEGTDIKGRGFKGVFDGNGHTIIYRNNDMTSNSALFPFSIRGGTIKNLIINVNDCVLDASKHDEGSVVGRVFSNSGGSMSESAYIENVCVYGDIKVIPDETNRKTVDCTVFECGNSVIKNCIVNVSYDLDKSKIEQFLQNTQGYGLNINLYQFGSRFTQSMNLTNCYVLGGYSSAFDEVKESISDYYAALSQESSSSYCIIAPIGGYVGELYPCSQDNCYVNVDMAPVYLVGQEKGLEYASLYYLNDDTMPKSTADLKKQETFLDYDFENVWGISEYINDGYPYLRALVNPDLVALVDQIAALPEPDKLTEADKETVEQIKAALEGLSDKDLAMIAFDTLNDKVAKAEEAIKAMEDDQKPEGDPSEKTTEKKAATTISIKKGTKFKVKGYKFTVTGVSVKNPTATITGYQNKKLKKVSIPATVTYKKVKFKVTAVGNNAFKGQKKAVSVTVGANVKTIGKAAFSGDKKVKKFLIKTKVLKKVGAKAFKGIHKKAVIKVPAKKLKAYKKLMKGKGQAKSVKIKK